MIEFEIAGLFYAIKKALSKDKDNVYETYFDEIPKDIFLPCVYFPAPEITESGWSSSAYKATFTLYVTVMAPTTSQAARMATDIVLDISSRRKKIPIVKEDGTISSHSFRVNTMCFPVTESSLQAAATSKIMEVLNIIEPEDDKEELVKEAKN